MLLGGLSTGKFLRDHWQKRPLLVRGAMPGFRDPLTPDELAGLSCEDGVESRIVREAGGAAPWEVSWGPHEESRFSELPEEGWTLLVQELNRHVPEAALLLEPFAFVPNVRVDDVMVSYAAPGGSVGPHLDSYDVFLVQGRGRRRWMWNERPTPERAASFRPGLDLRILERFRPDRDEVLEPGDMLYLPPGFAHHGVAVTPCMTYSVGFRAPNTGEMWTSLARAAAERPAGARLLVDPALTPAKNPGAIPKALLAEVRAMVRALDTSDAAIDRWFASFATRLSPGHTVERPRRAPGEEAIFERLTRGDAVRRSEEGRWAFLPAPRGGVYLYFAGTEIEVPQGAAELARALCASRRFEGAELARQARSRAGRALIARLFAEGALAFAGRRRPGGPSRRASAR